MRVMRYLAGTRHLGILFKVDRDQERPLLETYADADWAADPVSRFSTTGYIVYCNGTPISWHAGLQRIVAQSSTEAEYVALAEASNEVVYLRQLMSTLQMEQTVATPIYEDNSSTIKLVENPVAHKRSKHFDVRHHVLRTRQEEGVIKVIKVSTDDNCADIFTKAVPVSTFHKHVSAIMSSRACEPISGEGG